MNNIALIIGRFNPPTIGHYELISSAKKYARDNKELQISTIPYVVVIDGINKRLDVQTNPLSANERIQIMKASGKANFVNFIVATSISDMFRQLKNHDLNIKLIVSGSDRYNSYLSVFNNKDIMHLEVTRDEMSIKEQEEMIALGKAPSLLNVSSSFAKRCVMLDNFDLFKQVVGLEEELAKILFLRLRKRLKG